MNPIFIFLILILSFNVSSASFKDKKLVLQGNKTVEKHKRFQGFESLGELIRKCEQEHTGHFSNGSCLMLGIYAFNTNYLDLFYLIENLCIQKVRLNQITKDSETAAFLAYFPRCEYVLDGSAKAKTDKNLDLKAELKTLVRFLNN